MKAYRALRLRLTAVCAVSTGLVLAAMAAVSCHFSVRQLEQQFEQGFSSNVSAVNSYIREQAAITHTWLLQTEQDADLHIGVRSENGYLLHTGLDPLRDSLAAQAFQAADAAPSLLTHTPLTLGLEQGRYRAVVSQVWAGNRILQVALVKDRSAELAQVAAIRLGFTASAVAATACLLAFAWFFSAWATRPVEESRRQQTAFVGAASHEFRSPVAVIQMAAENLEQAPPELTGRFTGMILRECRRLGRLTEDMLQLAGADSRSLAVRLEPVNPEAPVLSTYEKFQPIAATQRVRLELDLSGAPLPKITCDRDRVEQILDVLMDNAIRYTPEEGGVTIGVHARRGAVLFTVTDSGPGIPDGQKDRIFERFYRVDASRTGKEHYGLGLSVAWELARLQQGKIFVEDAPGGGSLFVLRMPL